MLDMAGRLAERSPLVRGLLAIPFVGKISRFAVIGMLSGLIYLIVLLFATHTFACPPQVASVIAYVAALPVNFLGQRRFAFASSNNWRGDLVRYAVLVLLSLAASYGIVWLVSVKLGLSPLAGGVATILCIPVLTYVCMDQFVFRLWQPRTGE